MLISVLKKIQIIRLDLEQFTKNIAFILEKN